MFINKLKSRSEVDKDFVESDFGNFSNNNRL